MGFYGAGLGVLILAFIFTFFRPSLKAILKFVFITAISLFLAIYLLALLKPNVLDYNKANLKKLTNFNVETGPRKLISFYNYGIAYTSDLKDFLFGSGAGTFNSRSAFTVGSPYYLSAAGILKSENKPYYFQNYAYTLWNNTNTSQALFQDGFRNQPFSSVLSFLGEYGLLFTLAFAWCYLVYYKRVYKLSANTQDPLVVPYFRVFRFLFLLLPLLLLIDNFLEYPEVTFLVVLCMKLLHIELSKRQFNNPKINI